MTTQTPDHTAAIQHLAHAMRINHVVHAQPEPPTVAQCVAQCVAMGDAVEAAVDASPMPHTTITDRPIVMATTYAAIQQAAAGGNDTQIIEAAAMAFASADPMFTDIIHMVFDTISPASRIA